MVPAAAQELSGARRTLETASGYAAAEVELPPLLLLLPLLLPELELEAVDDEDELPAAEPDELLSEEPPELPLLLPVVPEADEVDDADVLLSVR